MSSGDWWETNPDVGPDEAAILRRRKASAVRNHRLAGARFKGTHADGEWEDLLHCCGYRCVRCGETDTRLYRDHIVPIYLGGCDCIHNIQPLCKTCNSEKGPECVDYRPRGWQIAVFGGGR